MNNVEEIFRSKVQPDLFAGVVSQEKPTLVFVGAPPASGKTQANLYIKKTYITNGVVIEGDSFRQRHPDYERLVAYNCIEMPGKTAKFSGQIVRLALDVAKENRYSIILEGTFRNTAMVMETANEFHEAGYTLRVATIATPPEVCALEAEERFLLKERGRWTPYDAQQHAWEGFPTTLDALNSNDQIASFDIFTRKGKVPFDRHMPPSQVVADLINSYWNPETAKAWCDNYADKLVYAENTMIDGKPYVYYDNNAWPSLYKSAKSLSAMAGITIERPSFITE